MEPRIFYFEEMSHDGSGLRTLHKVNIPELCDPGGSRDIESLNAFNSGKRKTASKEDKAHHRACCNWGPKSLFCCKADWEMDMSFEGTFRAIERIEQLRKDKFPDAPKEPNIMETQYGGNYKSWREIPTIDHVSIKDFFTHIGFDHKARSYVDKEGKAIKYSVIAPKPKEKTREAGIEI